MKSSKNAIALLITVMFVIVISVAIGFGLSQVNRAAEIVKNESFTYQSSIIVDDILNILKTSPDIASAGDTNSSEELYTLLAQTSFIPFQSSKLDIVLKLHSARGTLNPLLLKNINIATALREYLNRKMINNQYVDILLDCINGIKVDKSYSSTIFDENPYLFRNNIASMQHLEQINDFYKREYNDNSLQNVAFENLFYFSDTNSTTVIDLNYATSEVWEFMLDTTKERAEYLVQNAGFYDSIDALNLNAQERENLQRFTGIFDFFQPILLVDIEIKENQNSAHIRFEYDIKSKKESNFVYEI